MDILELILTYLYNNFAFILMVVSFFVILFTHQHINKRINKVTMLTVCIILVYAILVNIEAILGQKYYAYTETSIYIRILLSVICYICRPTFLLLILYTAIGYVSKKKSVLLWIPIIFIALIYSTAFFLRTEDTALVFAIDAENVWHPGPFGFILYVVAGLYALLLLHYTYQKFKNQNFEEGIIVAIELVAALVGAAIESTQDQSLMLPNVLIICVLFYYLYMLIEHTKRDQLTGLLNRQSYFADIERFKRQITAIISLDMNDLKIINDTKGHSEGDIALLQVSEQFSKSLIKGTKLYRVGGDEFEIMCVSIPEYKVVELIDTIRTNVNVNTDYTVAIGYSYIKLDEKRQPVQSLMVEADAKMYKNKSDIKEHNK